VPQRIGCALTPNFNGSIGGHVTPAVQAWTGLRGAGLLKFNLPVKSLRNEVVSKK